MIDTGPVFSSLLSTNWSNGSRQNCRKYEVICAIKNIKKILIVVTLCELANYGNSKNLLNSGTILVIKVKMRALLFRFLILG